MSRVPRQPDVPGLKTTSADVIYPHIFPNSDREVGGVLIGKSGRKGGLPLVTGAIEAISADEQRATLTFTQDAWEHIHQRLDADFEEDDEIVGWYHSHPGFGIFLSEHDLFIHRNFFSGKSQIAVVVDPHNRTEGTFIWNGDEIELLYERPTPEGWFAQSPRADFVPIETPSSSVRTAGQSTPKSLRDHLSEGNNAAVAAVSLLLGVLAAFGALQVSGCFDEETKTTTRTTTKTEKRKSESATPGTRNTSSPTSTSTTTNTGNNVAPGNQDGEPGGAQPGTD